MKPSIISRFVLLAGLLLGLSPQMGHAQESALSITHGPILGQAGPTSIGIWVRTSQPAQFRVRYRSEEGQKGVDQGRTKLQHDNAGWVQLTGLRPDTEYSYEVRLADTDTAHRTGTFRTLPSAEQHRNAEYNPDGLYNFSFAHGSCNFQFRRDGEHVMPAYQTMLREHADKVDFQIMNGDFIYEARRGLSVQEWQETHGTGTSAVPNVVQAMPRLVGVWANYKLYLDRSEALSEWHQEVPAYFVFDDHELFNDIKGTGVPGHRNRRTVYRDIGVRGWMDYLGWANPRLAPSDTVHYGRARLDAEEGVLTDPRADFQALDVAERPTLHVHWNDDHPAAGVYEAAEVLDANRLRLRPAPDSSGSDLAYSIGRRSYYSFRVSNAEFFVLDTRSHRGLHDVDEPDKPGLSMLGAQQKQWLKEEMAASDADVFFVVSSVSFTIPHIDPNQPNKDESWTVYLDEREELINFWDDMEQPVLLLTGDLHNSIVTRVSDNIREYVSGPHNSGNHPLVDEGSRPPSGPFSYNGREVDIQWSSFWLEDVPGRFQRQPYYVVVQVNNAFNNPGEDGSDRWVAYPEPQVVVQYYDGLTGELAYAESVTIPASEE